MIYEVVSVDGGFFIVRWMVIDTEITYPIPRDAQGKALAGDDLDEWLFERYQIDVVPSLSGQNNVLLEGEIGLQRTAKRKAGPQ